jgi:hypothetical protein
LTGSYSCCSSFIESCQGTRTCRLRRTLIIRCKPFVFSSTTLRTGSSTIRPVGNSTVPWTTYTNGIRVPSGCVVIYRIRLCTSRFCTTLPFATRAHRAWCVVRFNIMPAVDRPSIYWTRFNPFFGVIPILTSNTIAIFVCVASNTYPNTDNKEKR